jgi:hypothetical protein
VIAFTAHSVVFIDEDPPWVYRTLAALDCDGAVLVLGRGVAGRWEAAIEVDEEVRHRGLGVRWPRPRGIWYPMVDRSGRSRPPATHAASAPSRPPGSGRSVPKHCSSPAESGVCPQGTTIVRRAVYAARHGDERRAPAPRAG